MDGCPFCALDQIAGPLLDYGKVVVFEPLNPVVAGHMLVVPKKHVADFTEDALTFAETVAVASDYARFEGGSYNLITSKGREATQSVMHLHVHLVPRTASDGLALPWAPLSPPSTKE